jgi:two-component system nitrogen regulation response regulator GlnG
MTSDPPLETAQELSGCTPKPSDEQEAFNIEQLVGDLLRQGEADIYRKVGLAVDRVIVETVLRHTKGNQVQASELLGISRTTLRAKLRTLRAAIEKRLAWESDQTE